MDLRDADRLLLLHRHGHGEWLRRPRGRSSARNPIRSRCVVPGEGGFLVDEIVRRLEQQDFEVVRLETSSEEDAESEEPSKRMRRPLAGWRCPSPPRDFATLTDSVLAGEPADLEIRSQRRRGLAERELRRGARSARRVRRPGRPRGHVEQSEESSPRPRGLRAVCARCRARSRSTVAPGRRNVSTSRPATSRPFPGTLVMFTMLVLLTGGSTILLVIEREQGLLAASGGDAHLRAPRSCSASGSRKLALGLVQVVFAMLARAR